jgi:chorismate mutase
LLDLMNQRLAVMYDVARAKWNTKSPAEDAARERVVLDSVAERGKEFGLDPATTRAFFAAQIEAAKMIQRAAFAMWQAEGRGPFPDAPDLARDIRPKIDDLGRKLLAALAEFQRAERLPSTELRQRAEARLVGPGVTPEVRAEAIRPLEAA